VLFSQEVSFQVVIPAKAGIQWALVIAGKWMHRLDSRFRENDEIILKTAVGSMLKRLKPRIDAGLQPILATAEQFQIGARNNLAKLCSNRYMQPLCGVNCGF